MSKYKKPHYSTGMTIFLIVLLTVLVAVLGFIIWLEIRQIRTENSPQAQAGPAVSESERAAQEQERAQAQKQQEEAAQAAERARAARAAEAGQYSFYQKLAGGYDVNVLVLGDSILSGEGASSPDKSWDALLRSYLEETYLSKADPAGTVSVTNLAGDGNSVFMGYLTAQALEAETACDLAVLCFAHDDSAKDYGLYFEAMVRAIHAKYPDCAIISVIEAAEGGHTPKIEAMKTVCRHYDIPLADAFAAHYALGQKEFFGAFSDAVHPNDKGHELYFEVIREQIDEKVTADTGKMEDRAALNGDAARFDNLRYIPATDFTRTDELHFSLATPQSGVLLLESSAPIAREDAKVIADDILYTLPKAEPVRDIRSGNYLLTVNMDFVMKEQMELVFAEQAPADSFTGIYLAWKTPEEKPQG